MAASKYRDPRAGRQSLLANNISGVAAGRDAGPETSAAGPARTAFAGALVATLLTWFWAFKIFVLVYRSFTAAQDSASTCDCAYCGSKRPENPAVRCPSCGAGAMPIWSECVVKPV